MYETLRTKFVKKKPALQQLRDYLKRPRVQYLDDVPIVNKRWSLLSRRLLRVAGR